MGLFGKKPQAAPPHASGHGSAPAAPHSNPNHASEGGKSWVSATTAGGVSGNGWGSTDSTNGHDSAGSFDRNGWSYGNASGGNEWGAVGNEAWNGGGSWQNDGWNGPRERNEW